MTISPLKNVSVAAQTSSEQVLSCCATARKKLEAGDYDGGCAALQPWWCLGEWPRQSGLSHSAAAELFLVAGTLSGWVASSKRILGGRKPAEALLNSAIALFEQLGERVKAAEGRIELACCYYHQGVLDLAQITLQLALENLTDHDRSLRSVALIRLAVVERLAGRLDDALTLLDQATPLLEQADDWHKGRYHLEFANTLKELGIADNEKLYFDQALSHYRDALAHFQRVRNDRYTAHHRGAVHTSPQSK